MRYTRTDSLANRFVSEEQPLGFPRFGQVGMQLGWTHDIRDSHSWPTSGTLAELADYYSSVPPRGELTIVLEGSGAPVPEPARTEEAVEAATELLAEGLSRREVARRITESHGLSRNDAYRLVTGLP